MSVTTAPVIRRPIAYLAWLGVAIAGALALATIRLPWLSSLGPWHADRFKNAVGQAETSRIVACGYLPYAGCW